MIAANAETIAITNPMVARTRPGPPDYSRGWTPARLTAILTPPRTPT